MDASSQTDLQYSESSHGRCTCIQSTCGSCRDSCSGHGLGPVVVDCVLKGCYICADLAKLNDEISSTSRRLSDLLTERQKITEKPRHDTDIIHRMPVEILSSIFIFVKEAIFASKFEEYSEQGDSGPLFEQPFHSPPLLVGAFCKRWRDITLTTPKLWTNITVDFEKCEHGRLDMIKSWADRSGFYPLDITLHLEYPSGGRRHDEYAIAIKFGDVFSALISRVVRWNNVAFDVPGYICYKLLQNLHDVPHINSLLFSEKYEIPELNKLQCPLRPRRFLCGVHTIINNPKLEVTFKWDRLVFLDIQALGMTDFFHIMRCAPNLQHCAATRCKHGTQTFSHTSYTNDNITHHSVQYFKTNFDILGQLTFPMLRQLEYTISSPASMDKLVGFLDRSRTSLDGFVLRVSIHDFRSFGAIPRFQRFPGITSLFLDISDRFCPENHQPRIKAFLRVLIRRNSNPILPHLEAFSFEVPELSTSWWSLVSHLFPQNTQKNLQGLEGVPDSPIAFTRPLSQVKIRLTQTDAMTVDRNTFLRLLEVKKSGFDLSLRNIKGDMFYQMAEAYGDKL